MDKFLTGQVQGDGLGSKDYPGGQLTNADFMAKYSAGQTSKQVQGDGLGSKDYPGGQLNSQHICADDAKSDILQPIDVAQARFSGSNYGGFDNALEPVTAELLAGLGSSNPARSQLKNYIAQNCSHLNADEVGEIIALAQMLERHAVEEFRASAVKNIGQKNRLAIDKLSTPSADARASNLGGTHVFTRDEIARMSLQEFRANRPQIFAQYAKGLIK